MYKRQNTPHPVIDLLPKQREILMTKRYGASMRLGAYVAALKRGKVMDLYTKTKRMERDRVRVGALEPFRIGKTDLSAPVVIERHRHRYEVNPEYIEKIENAGLKFIGYHITEEDEPLMEFIELPDHPYFVASQSHPEFKSRLEDPAPLFLGFGKAVVEVAERGD